MQFLEQCDAALFVISADPPINHVLKNIEKAVDFSFINKLLEGSYSGLKSMSMQAKLTAATFYFWPAII